MIRETIIAFVKRVSDVLFEGRNGTRIILGTDRKNTVDSGYGDGGQNKQNSAAIDIVAGSREADPNYQEDSVRIYLCEKTDPDDYFGVNRGPRQTEVSALVQKADNIYLVGKKNIKIITNQCSILITENDIRIEAQRDINIKGPNITLETSPTDAHRILTEMDRSIGICPVTGAPISSDFRTPGAVITKQNTRIK